MKKLNILRIILTILAVVIIIPHIVYPVAIFELLNGPIYLALGVLLLFITIGLAKVEDKLKDYEEQD